MKPYNDLIYNRDPIDLFLDHFNAESCLIVFESLPPTRVGGDLPHTPEADNFLNKFNENT